MLTSKQRAYLRSLAVDLDTIVMVVKSGMSPELTKQADDAPLSSREAAEQIAADVQADVVQVIGSKFVLYRKNEKEPKITLPKPAQK